ncbi:conjugal transfer protein TraG, partial [Bacteroides fragilis]
MKISAAQAYCILDTVGSSILTKSGEISVSYLLELPEAYSLDRSDLEERHNELFRAFQYVRTGFIHKQDVFLRRKFKPEYVIEGEGYIQTAERKYFDGREYLHHFCILSFTLSGLQSLEKAYQANPLAYSEKLAKADRDRLAEFLESVESAVSIIRNIRGTQIRPLNVAEVKQHLFRYVNGFHDDEGLRDIQCSDMIRIGQKKGIFFAVCDERYLPDRMKVYVTDSTLQEANSQLYMSMLERIGVHVPCSHVVNQIWKFAGGSYREELAERVKLFGRYREFDKAIKSRYDGLASYEQEIINEENVLCKTHLNVLLLEDDETILNRQTEQVKMIFTNAGFKYYIPSYEGLYNIFIGSIIGRENNLNPDYLFLSDLHSSLCMGINYSTFRSDKEGILFNERLYQTPIRKDVWDADKKRIPARNMIIVASTGGGKSVTSLNIIQQNIEQNYKQIVVEFGKSFYQLSQLYPDRSLHIDYDGSSPLGINPFYTAGKQPDNEKIKTLVNLVLKFWRSKAIMEDTKQVVSLTKIICRYYEDIPDGHCFPDFYRYVQREGKKLYERLNILPEYFDIDSFLHVCSEFMPGGFYENVCKPSPLENDMQNRDFIVFELTKIKKDPFLISVIMTILFDTIENKILSDRSVRGMLIFDEYAESQSIKDTFSGADIHSTVAFCYQKLRKENGAVGTIVQSLAQLPDNEYTKGIIANTQLLYVLPA